MDLFAALRAFFRTETTTIDNKVFRLHYKVTALILIAFGVLVVGKQFIGYPIDCVSKDGIPKKILNNFCWILINLPYDCHKRMGEEVRYPCVDKYKPGETQVYHAYYQSVCFVLFLQAILFYVPRYFWKAMEGGRIKNLILGLNSPNLPEETKTAKKKLLVEYMTHNMNNHSMYFVWYVIAEIMNFINVVGQIFLMDAFLGGEFSTYGSKMLQVTNWDWSVRYDLMIKVFPRLAKCTFPRNGSSGDVQRHYAMCILPINIINEHIYVFLWFWFIILAILSGLALVYRGFTVFFPRSRFMVTKSRARLSNQVNLESIINKCGLSDWFLLDLLSKNLDPLNFRDVVNDLAKQLYGKIL